MNHKITTCLVLALLLGAVLTQNCSASSAVDQLATGSYTFQLSAYANNIQCYNATLDSSFVSSQPQLTSGVSSIGNLLSGSSMDFTLRSNLQSSNTQASFTIIVKNASWTSIKINYLVSARP